MNLSDMNPTDPAYLSFCYGHNHFQRGNCERAIASFSKAIESMPNFVNGYYFRGCVYLAKGNNARAARDFYSAKQCREQLLIQ